MRATSLLIPCGLAMALLAGCGRKDDAGAAGPAGAASAPPAQNVSVVQVKQADVPVTVEASGTVTALQSVDLRAQTTSTVAQVLVKDGQTVKKGELLFRFDDRADRAALEKARAQLARDRASLMDLERQLNRAKELKAEARDAVVVLRPSGRWVQAYQPVPLGAPPATGSAVRQKGVYLITGGLGGIGLNVIQGARMAGANKIIGVDINPKRKAMAEKFGMTHFVNPKDAGGELVPHLVALTDGGADYSFECVGHVDLMRQALECCHRGWGVSVIIGVAGAGQEIKTRPFQLVTGRVWKGTAFGGARGRTDVPKIVDWYMDKKINIDDLITHVMPIDNINDAFDLMHKGESIRSVVTF